VGPRAGLEEMGKRNLLTIPALELRPLGRSSRSQSLTDCAIPALNVTLYNRECVLTRIVLGNDNCDFLRNFLK
jgi:hypothetical protein